MIKAILFDLDGVVIDSEPLYQKGEERLFREYGVEIPEADWKLFRGSTEEIFYRMARERYKIEDAHHLLRNRGRRYVLEEFDRHLDYMPGFHHLIERFEDSYQIGLVTATPEDIFRWIDKRLSLTSVFQKVLWGGMTRNGKPHPEPYLKMMEMLTVKPHESVIIEDSLHGINAGLSSGAAVIALAGSLSKKDMPAGCTIVNSLDDITTEMVNSLRIPTVIS